jgi:putative ATP-dependent endonuclease of OLD family
MTKTSLKADIVRIEIKELLNQIFSPDAYFTEIFIKENDEQLWEIFLEEKYSGTAPLAHSGSGLKTILLVLLFTHILPKINNFPISQYVFMFEELENNLHPALQRRLLGYITNLVQESGCSVFLTSHSSTFIDFFARDEAARIFHVTHTSGVASCELVQTYLKHHTVLDDLDVRASDLLQANCIIWVEGPSDRIYVNRWLELYGDGNVREGQHYQCVFYGRRLLSHLSADSPDDTAATISILRVNRHAAILIDSDKKAPEAELNATKKRIVSEIEGVGGFAWVTAGREVENYVPCSSIETNAELFKPQVGQFESIAEYLATIPGSDFVKNFDKKKVPFAEDVVSRVTKENLLAVLDLADRLQALIIFIKRCNGERE